MGIYVFSRKILLELFDSMPKANDFGKEIIPTAVQDPKYKVSSYPFGGYWTDIGNILSYFEANLHLTEFLPQFNLYDNKHQIYTSVRMLAPSKIFGTQLNFALLSDGCIIHAKLIEHCVIGIRSRIGSGTIIRRAIISGNDYYQALRDVSTEEQTRVLGIGKNCIIMNAIIDKNVKIGNDVQIIGDPSLEDFENELYCIREGIIIIKKGATIEDNLKIGKK